MSAWSAHARLLPGHLNAAPRGVLMRGLSARDVRVRAGHVHLARLFLRGRASLWLPLLCTLLRVALWGARLLRARSLSLLVLLWVRIGLLCLARSPPLRELLDHPRIDVSVDLGAVIRIAEVWALWGGRGGGALLLLRCPRPQDPVDIPCDVRVDLGALLVLEDVAGGLFVRPWREAPRWALAWLLWCPVARAWIFISVVG